MAATVPADFTYDMYRRLLDSGVQSYDFLTVREYLERDALPDTFVVLRHDVDRKPANAAMMAEIEAAKGISSTYYFRTVDGVFRPDIIHHIEDLGHEVGYHYEDLDRADGDVERAHEHFDRNLRLVRRCATVDTVCMHGNPLTAHDNRDMWARRSFEEYDLLGEAYLSMDFEDVVYYSDTGRTWADGGLKIKDHTMGEGEKPVQADTTMDLAQLLMNHRVSRACLLSHPDRWAGSFPELVTQRAKDSAINVVKRGINIIQ